MKQPTKNKQILIGSNVTVISYSMKTHQATRAMLERYPLKELQAYAKSIGIKAKFRTKSEIIVQLLISGKATICGGLGN